MTAVGEEMLSVLRDTYLFSYFTGTVEELSPDQLIQVYLRLLNVFDNNYDMKSSDGKQPQEPNVSSGSALKHILRYLRNMELLHLVGSSKPSQLYDKKTSLRLISALHDKITARHGSKTAHRVRIVVKTDKLARRERKKPPLDKLLAADDAPASKRQDKENSDSCFAESVSASIPADLTIKEKVEIDHLEARAERNSSSSPVSVQKILKEADRGAGRPLMTGELPGLIVPKQGRELARTPVRLQTSTDKGGYDESDDSVSSPPITMEALSSPALLQPNAIIAVPRVKSSANELTTTDTKVPMHSGETSMNSSLPTKTQHEIPSARQEREVITQPLSSAVSPPPQDPCRTSNGANVRKSVAPILSGAYVELPLTPVGAPASEDRNVIPSGRQITRTPVAAKLEDDPSLDDSCVTPGMKDEIYDVPVLANTDHVHVSKANKNKFLEGNSKQDSNETYSAVNLQEQLEQSDDRISMDYPNNITVDYGSKESVDVTVADRTPLVKNNHSVRNTLFDSPIVKTLLNRQENSPRFIPFPVDKGKKRPGNSCIISAVDSCEAQGVAIDTGGANAVPCLPEMESNLTLSSADENDVTASPSVCRDPPLLNDALNEATEGCSSSVDLGNIILEPPPGFDSSCPSNHGEDSIHSSSNFSESLVPETCSETRLKFPSVALVEKESPDHLSLQKCDKDRTYNLETIKMNVDKRKTFVLPKTISDSDSKGRRTTFVVPKTINSVTTVNLNTRDCKRQTFVVPPDQIGANTLIVQANESFELIPSPGMPDVTFGDLTLLPKDIGETFLVDKNVPDTLECSSGQLALSSTGEESPSSIKCPRSCSERSEEGSDAPSTPSTRREGSGDVNYVPHGRQLYRTPVTGLGKDGVNGGPELTDDGSSEAVDDLDNQAIENENKLAKERLSSASVFSAETEMDIKTDGQLSADETEESNIIEKSGNYEKDARIMVEVPSMLEKDSSCSGLDETLSNESSIKPVQFQLCKNETYVKESPNNGKSAVLDMEDSCDLDDSGNIFAPVKNKLVKRNLPVEKRSRGAGIKGVKRSRKDSIEHLLIKQLNAEHLLSPLNSVNDPTDLPVGNIKKEVSPFKPNRGRKKKVNAITKKKKIMSSAISKTQAKAKKTGDLAAAILDNNGEREVKIDPKEGTSAISTARREEIDDENLSRPHRGKVTAKPANKMLSSVLDENAGNDEMFDRLEDQTAQRVTKVAKLGINRKITHSYSKKDEGDQTNVSRKKASLTKVTKKKSSDEMIITAPQELIESDDLIDESPDAGTRRSRRQRGTEKVDYNQSRFVTPTLPPSRARRGRSAKRNHDTPGDGDRFDSDTHKTDDIIDSPPTFSEFMLETSTTNKENLECPNDDLNDEAMSKSNPDEMASHDVIGEDSDDINDSNSSKQPSHRGRARGRGGNNRPSPVLSAAKTNAATRGRSRKRNVLVHANDTFDVPETVAPEVWESAVTHPTRGRGKRGAASGQTRKQGNVAASPTECILETFAPPLEKGSELRRGRVRNAAQRGKGRGAKPTASKDGPVEDLDDENRDFVDEVLKSASEKEGFNEEESISVKKIARGRGSGRTTVVKNKRATKIVNKKTLLSTLSPVHPGPSQNENEEHSNKDEILSERGLRKGKTTAQEEGREIQSIVAIKANGDEVQKKRAPVISKTKAATKTKVQKFASDQESKFVEAETSLVPKRKREGTHGKEHDNEVDEESPSKIIREEAVDDRSGEASSTLTEKVSSRAAKGTKSKKTKTQSVKSSLKVNFESPVRTSAVKRRGASKSKVVPDGSPAAVLASKPRVTRARAGRGAAAK